MKKIINLLLGLSLCLNSYTQTSQLKSFDKEIFKEDFNSKNAPFHINSDKDNYMVIDDGDLFINRTNPSLAQAVFSKNSIETTAYRLKTAIKAGPSTKRNSYSGIVINSSLDSKEMVAIEINGNQEYRIRKISTKSKFLSGSESNKGWTKSSNIKKNGEYNNIDIISNKGIYDLFINSKHQTTVKVPELSNGGFGFIIGPNSQARIDYLNVYAMVNNANSTQIISLKSKIDIQNHALAKKVQLEKEKTNTNLDSKKAKSLNQLQTENKALSEKLKKIATLEKENERLKNKLNDYSDLKKANTALNQKIGLLSKVNEENKDLKSDIKKNNSLVISSKNEVISATKSLASIQTQLDAKKKELENLKEKNSQLNSELSALKNSDKKLNQELNTLKTNLKNSASKETSSLTKMKKLNEEKAKLNSDLNTTKKALATAKNKISELEKQNISQDGKILAYKDKQDNFKRMKSENEDFKNGFIEMESVNAKLSQEIKTLKLENTDYQRIKKEYGITQALLDKSNAQLKKKTDKIVSMKKKSSSLLELQRELSDLKSKNSKLTTQLNALNSKHEKLENNEKSILNSLAKYSTQNKNLNKSLNTAQLTNESLKNKFDKLEELSSKYEVIEKRNKFLENQYNIVSEQNNEQKLIASQFAESFQLEKQKNKQLHNEILSLYSEEGASENSKSVVYRVQLGIFDELIDVEGIENLTTIHTQAQQIIYIAGKFDNFSSARGYLLEMSKKGFKDAFIVKF